MFGRKPKIKFMRISDVNSPKRSTKYSCGIDFYIPNESDELIDLLKNQEGVNLLEYKDSGHDFKYYINVNPHSSIMIPSGIKVNIPKTKALFFDNKSGIASRLQLIRGACLVDSDYKEEIFFNLINTSKKVKILEFGQKIIQGILIDNYMPKLVECRDEDELFKGKENTRFGGFGSTGLK